MSSFPGQRLPALYTCTAFDRHCDAGGPCAQRLAARLIPRLLLAAPERTDSAIAALAVLAEARRVSSSAGETEEVKATVSATRCDAMRGLEAVCVQAGAREVEQAEAIVSRVAILLLR